MAKTNASKSNGEKGRGKKKGSPKRKKMMMLAGDPPIVVGGGGSTLIWVRNDFTLTQIPLNQVSAEAPPPHNRENYQIYEIAVAITTSTVRLNQAGGQSKHTGMDKKKFTVEFDV
jgi:hypothetical protein